MRIDELEQALDRYGGDTGRWPDALRVAGEELIATDLRAAALAKAAVLLDTALDEIAQPMAVDSALIGRITAGMAASHELSFRPTGRLAAFAGAAMVAFLITGYAAGLVLPASQGEDAIAGLMFGNSSATTSDTGSSL